MRHKFLKDGINRALGLASLGMLLVPNAAHAGYYALTGTVNSNGHTSTITATPGQAWSGSGGPSGPSSAGPNYVGESYTAASASTPYPQYNMNSTVTFNITATWTPSYAGDTSAPPASASFLETASNSAECVSSAYNYYVYPAYTTTWPTPSATCDDGLSDQSQSTGVVIGGQGNDATFITVTSAGKHLVPESGNTFTFTVTMTDTGFGDDNVGATCALTIVPDTRGASIQSDLPVTTYHLGPNDPSGVPTRVIDVPVSGVMTATTVGPYDDLYADFPQIKFSGIAIGTFGADSLLNMYSSAKSYTSSGTFTGSGVVSYFTNVYDDLSLSQEHIHLRLTDNSDGAQAIANYYVNFRAPIEGWTKTGTVNFPKPFDPNQPDADPEWHRVCDLPDDTSVAPTDGANQSVTFNITYAATVGGSTSLTPDDILKIEQNESVTLNNSVTETAGGTQNFPGAAWSDIAYYAAETYSQDVGTCLTYGKDGFDGQQPWTCVSYISPLPSIGSVTLATYSH